MARALSDTVIVAMIEAATRLAGGRGPILGSVTSPAPGTDAAPPVERVTAAAAPATPAVPAQVAEAPPADQPRADAGAAAEHDRRTADQIASDFRTIYKQIEELVRSSAQEETKSIGFGVR